MNIFTDFFSKTLMEAKSDDRPGADGLQLKLGDHDTITVYMDAQDAAVYSLAINGAKVACLSRRLNEQKTKGVSPDSSPVKLSNIS